MSLIPTYLPTKQRVYALCFIFMGIVSLFAHNPLSSTLNEPHLEAAKTIDKTPPEALEAKENFAPGIAAILTTTTLAYNGLSPGCTNIQYGVRVFNTSTNNEALTNLVLNLNQPEGQITSVSGDDNNNGQLDVGEVWFYSAIRPIIQDELDLGEANDQITITADVVGQPGVSVSDDSDPTDINLDNPNKTDVSHCSLPYLKMLVTSVTNDCNSLTLTYTVTNTAPLFSSLNYESLYIESNLLGIIPAPNPNGEAALDPGEIWQFDVNYAPTATDLAAGQIVEQAHIYAEVKGGALGFRVSEDLSDFSSFNLDRPTIIDISACTPSIGLIKTGAMNAECTTIEYTFTVTNTSQDGQVLQGINVTDAKIPVLQGPFGDINNDSFLEQGETWTYTANYPPTTEEYLAAEVINQASVEATFSNGIESINIIDSSHPSDLNLNGETILDISSCSPGILLTKTGQANVDNDNDNCIDGIMYTFTVANTGNVDLDSIQLNDDLLGGPVAGPLANEDVGNDGILSVGEEWTYQAEYTLLQADIDQGTVNNNAEVTATIVGAGNQISNSQSVETILPADLCILGPGIAAILNTTSRTLGGTTPGCSNIEYNIRVFNTSTNNESLAFVDLDLNQPDGQITEFSGDDNNNSQLDAGEVWFYTAIRPITEAEQFAQEAIDQVSVTADVVGQPGVTVADLSHPTDIALDNPNRTNLVHCAPYLKLIATATVNDCNSVTFTYTILNTAPLASGVTYEYATLVLESDLLGTVLTQEPINNTLDPGEQWEFTADYVPSVAELLAGEIVEQAYAYADPQIIGTVISEDISDFEDINLDRPTVTSITPCSEGLLLTKTGQANVDADSNGCIDGILYTFTVSNTGALDMENVVLNDILWADAIAGPLSGEDIGNDGILSAGEEWTYEASYSLEQSDIDAGLVNNEAEVTATLVGAGTPVFNDAAIVTNLPVPLCAPAPAIQLVKAGVTIDSDADTCIDAVRYTFTVSNTGNTDLYTVELTDDKIGGTVAGPLPGEDIGNDGVLSVGEEWTYQADYTIEQLDIDQGSVDNQAGVTALSVGDDAPVGGNDGISTPLPADLCAPAPAIQLVKAGTLIDTDADSCFDAIRYTFTVNNTGNVDLYTVELTDDKIGGTVAGPLPGEDIGNDGVLSVGEEWTYQADYTIEQLDIDQGSVDNQAGVTALSVGDDAPVGGNDGTNTALPAQLCELIPSIGLIKTGSLEDLNNDGCFETIRYSFSVINTGDLDLETVVLEDDFLGGQINGPVNGDDQGNDDLLSVGETWNYETYYPISQTDIDLGTVSNRAEVTAVPVGSNTNITDLSDNNSPLENDFTVTNVPQASCTMGGLSIAMIKTGMVTDSDADDCPESIKYTFTVTNTGAVDLENVAINDPKIVAEAIIFYADSDLNEDGILSVGESWTYVGLFPFTQEDIATGFVNNQATVTANPMGSNLIIQDMSDDDSLMEDGPTITDLLIYPCYDGDYPKTEFKIFTGITPDGDGINDYFRINGIENYPNNELKIFNRWGAMVYEAKGYGIGNTLFSGISEGQATISKERNLPSGTYFYVLTFANENPGKESYSGYLYINRD